MDFGKEEKDFKQQNNSLTCRPLYGNPGRWRNCDGWDLLFLCSSLASDRFFQVLLPNSGTCLLGVLWLLPGGKCTIWQSAEGSWSDDYLKYSLQWLGGRWLCVLRTETKGGREFLPFSPAPGTSRQRHHPHFPISFSAVFVLQKGTCRKCCFLQIFCFALTK